MWDFFYKLASPRYFYEFAGRCLPWLTVPCVLLFAAGLYDGFLLAPPDYQQGESYRIMFVHVPAAWMSLFVYVFMAVNAGIGLIWRIKLSEIMARASAPVGAAFTFLALVTGSLWGKPMWGTYWDWDARMTSELILLFLYLGFIALQASIEDPRAAAKAGAILALAGLVNVPIIHYSVEWWNTLHQGPSVSKLSNPSIHISMLTPLIWMALAYKLYFAINLLLRARCEVLWRERGSQWVNELLMENKS
ncbi:MAG TPA: heme ABC transporter permease [Gammaproteobacteria bacterium]